MTRFGMKERDFQTLAGLMADLIKNKKTVKDEIKKLRERFIDMQFCFNESDVQHLLPKLL